MKKQPCTKQKHCGRKAVKVKESQSYEVVQYLCKTCPESVQATIRRKHGKSGFWPLFGIGG